MKLNLKSTIAAPAGNKSLNGIIGNTSRGIVVDKTLDPDSNNPVSNKPVSTALAALVGKIDAALQKPTGLTKTKLVGVGTSGQENIEIGENLTLIDGKLAAVGGGGGGIPVVEGTEEKLTEEEQLMGAIGKYTIPEAQNSNFILKTPGNNYIYINYYGTIYTAIVSIPDLRINICLYGAETCIYFLNYNPSSCNFLPYTDIDEATKSISYSDFNVGAKNVVYFTPVQFGNNHYTFMFCYSEEQGIEGYGVYHQFDETHLLYIDTYSYANNTLTIKLKEEELLNTKDLKLVTLFTKNGMLGDYKIYTDPSYNSDSILPCTKEDKGKVLQVDVNGYPQWANVGGGSVSVTFED